MRWLKQGAAKESSEVAKVVSPVNIDADPAVRAANDTARDWEQIGGHERVARRTARNKGQTSDFWYVKNGGPPATKEQRAQAYRDLMAKHPEWKPL